MTSLRSSKKTSKTAKSAEEEVQEEVPLENQQEPTSSTATSVSEDTDTNQVYTYFQTKTHNLELIEHGNLNSIKLGLDYN